MDDHSKLMYGLKVQVANYIADHGAKACLWMLDCKTLRACQVWIDEWNRNAPHVVECVKKYRSPIRIFEETYHILLNRKAIKPMPEGTDLEELVTELFGTNDIRYCKMIYLLSQLPVEINLEGK